MTHTEILVSIFSSCNFKTYLELGVSHGENLKYVSRFSENSIGVDIIDIRYDKSTNIIISTTDDFFRLNNKTFDLIFIDANHDIDFVRKDLINSIKVLNKNGIIALHDTDPEEPWLLVSEFCSDAYKIRNEISIGFESLTIPCNNAGLTLVKRKGILRYEN